MKYLKIGIFRQQSKVSIIGESVYGVREENVVEAIRAK